MSDKKITCIIGWVDSDLLDDIVAELGYQPTLQKEIEVETDSEGRNGRDIVRYLEDENGVEDLNRFIVTDYEEVPNEQTPEQFINEDIRVEYLLKRILPIVKKIQMADALEAMEAQKAQIEEQVDSAINSTITVNTTIE